MSAGRLALEITEPETYVVLVKINVAPVESQTLRVYEAPVSVSNVTEIAVALSARGVSVGAVKIFLVVVSDVFADDVLV